MSGRLPDCMAGALSCLRRPVIREPVCSVRFGHGTTDTHVAGSGNDRSGSMLRFHRAAYRGEEGIFKDLSHQWPARQPPNPCWQEVGWSPHRLQLRRESDGHRLLRA